MLQIEINVDEAFTNQVSAELLKKAAEFTLAQQNVSVGELTILVSHDEMLAALNQSYRGITSTTDVLSFPSGDAPAIPDRVPYLGDIAISFPQASQQAAAAAHPVDDELQLLVVHGTLHLLGHDHAGKEHKQQMWQAQGEILNQLGVAIEMPAE